MTRGKYPNNKTVRAFWERVFRFREVRPCHYCGCALNYENATMDHKIPRSRGGTNQRSNLVVCCDDCNKAKGSQEYAEFKAWSRYKRHCRKFCEVTG